MPRFPEAETAIFLGRVAADQTVSNSLVTTNSVSALSHLLELLPQEAWYSYSFEFINAVEFLRDNPVNAQTFVDTIHNAFAVLPNAHTRAVNNYTRAAHNFEPRATFLNTNNIYKLPDRDCRISLNALQVCLTTIKLPKYLFDKNNELEAKV